MGFGFSSVGFVGSLSGAVSTAPAVVNRGLQFVGASSEFVGILAPGYSSALNGATWSIEFRVRLDALTAGGAYMLSRGPAGIDEFALIYNFVANTMEFFSSTGPARLALAITTPPGPAYQTVKFAYDGSTLNGYLNGALSSSRAGAFSVGSLQQQGLRVGARGGNVPPDGPSSITVDYLKIINDGVLTLSFDFNEPAAPYANSGSGGGYTDSISTTPPTSVLV